MTGWTSSAPVRAAPGRACVQVVEDAFLTRFESGWLRTHQGPDRWVRGAVHDADGDLVVASQRLGGAAGDAVVAADPSSTHRPSHVDVLRGEWLYAGHWMPSFGSFVIETLTNLWPAPGRIRGIVCHRFTTPSIAVQKWQKQLVDLALGRGLDVEIVSWRPVRVERLLVPTRPFAVGAWALPEAVDVWRRVGMAVARDTAPVFLSRSGHATPVLRAPPTDERQDRELDRTFAAAGFRVISPETMPVSEQISAVARAPVIAGSAGPALHLAAFATSPTRVLQLGDLRSSRAPLPDQSVINAACGHLSVFVPYGVPVAAALAELDLPARS